MSLNEGTVFIVDDDPDVCRAVGRLVRGAGYEVREFNSARDFLVAHESEPPGCLLLDLSMPEVDGLQLQQSLMASGCHRPIVFLSANGDVHNTVRAMKAGAVNFLTKPVDEDELMDALAEAVALDAAGRAQWETRNTVAGRLATLTDKALRIFDCSSGRCEHTINSSTETLMSLGVLGFNRAEFGYLVNDVGQVPAVSGLPNEVIAVILQYVVATL